MLQCVAVCCSILQCVPFGRLHTFGRLHIKKRLCILAPCTQTAASLFSDFLHTHRGISANFGASARPINHMAVLVCCSVLQCVAVCCSVLQCVAVSTAYKPHGCLGMLQCVAVCCSVLQCVAVCCSVLQCPSAPPINDMAVLVFL